MTKLRLGVGAIAMLMPLAFTPLGSAAPLNSFSTTMPETTPPLHGTNPHGEGTVAVTELSASPTRPFSSDPSGKGPPSELLVVGRSRGEQRADGTYHGHITVAAVAGTEIAMVDTTPGQSSSGPLTGTVQSLLSPLGLGLVNTMSSTTATGSTNHFSVASLSNLGASVPGAPTLPLGLLGLGATAASSDGNITSDGICQTATGDSLVAGANLGPTILANVIASSTISRACQGQAPTETDSSTVIPANQLLSALSFIPATGCASGGNGLPNNIQGIPANTPGGVANNPTKGLLTGIAPGVLDVVCNVADQSPGVSTNSSEGAQQATSPYGVREALDIFLLATGSTPLAKITTSAANSTATAPPAGTPVTPVTPTPVTPTPNPKNPKNPKQICNRNGDNDCFPGKTSGPSIPENGPLDRSRDCQEQVENTSDCGGGEGGGGGRTRSTLPFTGLDALPVGLLGVLLLGSGLALRRFSGRLND